jgi:hypothetical protein
LSHFGTIKTQDVGKTCGLTPTINSFPIYSNVSRVSRELSG